MGRIVLEQVTKSFGDVTVIPPLDLTIEDGEISFKHGDKIHLTPRSDVIHRFNEAGDRLP